MGSLSCAQMNSTTFHHKTSAFRRPGASGLDRAAAAAYPRPRNPEPVKDGPFNMKNTQKNDNTKLFTSESVSEGHPDKLCDAVSDAILDACLAQDPQSRVACETLAKTGILVVAGEITTRADFDYAAVARKAVAAIGYDNDEVGYNASALNVIIALQRQSPDIAQGVDARKAAGKATAEQGAGDQGMMFGFACDETPELMPMPVSLAHAILRELAKLRKAKKIKWLRPDAKSQVSVEYRAGKPARVAAVVVFVLLQLTRDRATVSISTAGNFLHSLPEFVNIASQIIDFLLQRRYDALYQKVVGLAHIVKLSAFHTCQLRVDVGPHGGDFSLVLLALQHTAHPRPYRCTDGRHKRRQCDIE